MKIWLDITNAPHVNFFRKMVQELSAEHDFIVTSRDLSNTLALLDLFGINNQVVGRHYGASKWKKLLGFFERTRSLRQYLLPLAPDVAISHSSFYSPIVARSLGVPSIYLNDNEHAAGNILSYLFCNRIMVPEAQSIQSVRRQMGKESKVTSYPGVKEGVYLSVDPEFIDFNLPNKLPENKQLKIYVRPEPWAAQYYSGKRNFLDDLIADFIALNCQVCLLPRGNEQASYYSEIKHEGFSVIEKAIRLNEIAMDCNLFVGAGGTMTRELAVLGVPTISTYQGELLEVDRFLIEKGFMIHDRSLKADRAMRFLDGFGRAQDNADLMDRGKKAHELIKKTLLDIA